MKAIEILPYVIALVPALIFYLAYWQYFVFNPDVKNHLIAFASGTLAAALLAFCRIFLPEIPESSSILVKSFLFAGFLEKLIIFLVVVLFLRTKPITPVEVIVGAAIAGLGFSVVENILYAANFKGILVARTLAVTPLHFATSGLMGYYIAMMRMGKTSIFMGTLIALGLASGLHGMYDLALLSGRNQSYLALIPLLIAIIILDFRMAQMRTVPPSDILNAMGISFKGWLINQRQFQYERWILKEKADFDPGYEPLFNWRLHRFRIVLGILLLLLPGWYLIRRGQMLSFMNPDAVLSFFVFLPLALIMILLAVGIFNPAYFKHGIIRVPAMMQSQFLDHSEIAQTVAYDLRSYGCFIKTATPLNISETIKVQFQIGKYVSGPIHCSVGLENHKNIKLPLGSLLVFDQKGWQFRKFLITNTLLRLRSGLALFFKLPGHALIKRLFITPESVVRNLRFFPEGTQILHEGKRGQEFFLIRQGEIEIFKTSSEGVETLLAKLGPGQIVGEMAIAGNVPRNASARCSEESILSMADGSDLDSLVRQNPDFARQLLATVASRAFRSGETLEDRLNVLERQVGQDASVLRSVLLLALLGSQGNALKDNVIQAKLDFTNYNQLNIHHNDVVDLMVAAAKGQTTLADSIIHKQLDNLKLRLKLKKPEEQ